MLPLRLALEILSAMLDVVSSLFSFLFISASFFPVESMSRTPAMLITVITRLNADARGQFVLSELGQQ